MIGFGTGEYMRMYIDQSGRHVQSSRIYHLRCAGSINVLINLYDFSIAHGNIHYGIDIILRVDNVAAFDYN